MTGDFVGKDLQRVASAMTAGGSHQAAISRYLAENGRELDERCCEVEASHFRTSMPNRGQLVSVVRIVCSRRQFKIKNQKIEN